MVGEEEIVNLIEIERLKDFKNQPFKVKKDRLMNQLIDSISHYGILNPLVVRPSSDGSYEIISGHRRKYAAKQLGYHKLPVIIRIMDNAEAVISLVDSNLQREIVSPSEKAFAYKMKYDALKRKAGKRKSGQNDHIWKGKKTVEIIGKELGDCPKQVQRYLKLTELSPKLLEMLDDGKISFTPAFELAFLSTEEQEQFIDAMEYTQATPSLSQAQRIKKLSQEGKLTEDLMKTILGEVKKGRIERVTFKNEQLYKYFPKNYPPSRMKREIIDILNIWFEKYWEQEA